MAEPLSGIGPSIISSLLYDGGKKLVNRATFQKIYEKALKKCAKDLEKSDQIKDVIKGKKLFDLVEDFQLRGRLVKRSDLEVIFYPILGDSANIFVHGFWSQLLHEISQDHLIDRFHLFDRLSYSQS